MSGVSSSVTFCHDTFCLALKGEFGCEFGLQAGRAGGNGTATLVPLPIWTLELVHSVVRGIWVRTYISAQVAPRECFTGGVASTIPLIAVSEVEAEMQVARVCLAPLTRKT
eukprot:SAG31_NODE_25031_length_469_cov_1.027027_2_plen_110_part_01